MSTLTRHAFSIYVDRKSEDWVVQDCDGGFWLVPAKANGWDMRQPFHVTNDTQLEPVPGHYRHMLGIPA